MSLLQSKFKIVKESPIGFVFIIVVLPILIFGKAASRGIHTWTGIAGAEIMGYTLVLAYMYAKHIMPKINEAYIYVYTLLHWYFLLENISNIGWNFWLMATFIVSVYPTFLILKNVFIYKELTRRNKAILFYWFLFTVLFTYADQMALNIIAPVLTQYEISIASIFVIFLSAIQLYFMATTLTLLFLGVPLFHGGNGDTWKEKMRDWRKLLAHKLNSYVEYQVSWQIVVLITIISLALFYYDYNNDFRSELIYIYTIVFPIIFFYFKISPENSLKENDDTDNINC
jgi:hypothetical protein